jgi:pimeloyl-ACP methyl ester carboxylesterase
MTALPTTRPSSFLSDCLRTMSRHRGLTALAAATAAIAGAAIVNRQLARKAERDNPAQGRFIEVGGVRLHYVERGSGRPLVLFHGNGSMIQDFQSSGLIDLAAQQYRVIVFDRPGFGHSSRPRTVVWTPERQADLFNGALRRLGVERAIVLGHSWGASVAVALATRHPSLVQALVLASGYYFPTARADVPPSLVSALPGIGDLLSSSISPIIGRLMWQSMLQKLFGPQSVPAKFVGFPKEMALRPSQLRASAAEAALMVPAAVSGSRSYGALELPTFILAGENDGIIDIERQSARLHREIRQSELQRIPGAGHMIQQSATPAVMAAINQAAAVTLH